jgi:hypothetical protein
MEAPEKIKIGKHNITSDGDVVFGWVTNNPDCEAMQHDIEYIRTDVFTNKAAVWFANRYQVNGSYLCADDTDDFEKYMKAGIKNDKIIVFESGLKEQK